MSKEKRYIIALDEGTTSARTLIYDCLTNGIVSVINKPFKQYYPKPGWVEHDPDEIWDAQLSSLTDAIKETGIDPQEVYGIGITNQRETVIVWDKKTGKPIYNAIVWQCRRTTEVCEKIKRNVQLSAKIRSKTGLVIDAYFSATKIKWILDNVEGARQKAENGELCCGTIDTYLAYKLSEGKAFVTDYSNAARTLLFNISALEWDDDLLELFGVPKSMLPKIVSNSEIVGNATVLGCDIPIAGLAGDQQSALFGQCCFEEGMAKSTYGTGGFILMNTGDKPVLSPSKLLTTIAWGVNGEVTYAIEGSIFNAGSSIQWLRDELHLIESASETNEIASSVPDTAGVYVVPAFTGLGAPYWDMNARGAIVGITRGANRSHLVRATLESMAYGTKDILENMRRDSAITLKELRVDGGVARNDFLMQFQADMLNCNIIRPTSIETTALGVVYLAGLATGAFKDLKHLEETIAFDRVFKPDMAEEVRKKKYAGWKKAVKRALAWED